MRVTVKLVGCDDVTKFDMDITPDEYKLLGLVASLSSEASDFDCMPVMWVGEQQETP